MFISIYVNSEQRSCLLMWQCGPGFLRSCWRCAEPDSHVFASLAVCDPSAGSGPKTAGKSLAVISLPVAALGLCNDRIWCHKARHERLHRRCLPALELDNSTRSDRQSKQTRITMSDLLAWLNHAMADLFNPFLLKKRGPANDKTYSKNPISGSTTFRICQN